MALGRIDSDCFSRGASASIRAPAVDPCGLVLEAAEVMAFRKRRGTTYPGKSGQRWIWVFFGLKWICFRPRDGAEDTLVTSDRTCLFGDACADSGS